MTEITQADRDAAARAWAEDNDEPLDCYICEQIRAGYGDNSLDVIRFAHHRMEERAAIVAWLREEALERMRSKHEAEPMTFQYFCREAEQRELEHQADNFEAGEHLK